MGELRLREVEGICSWRLGCIIQELGRAEYDSWDGTFSYPGPIQDTTKLSDYKNYYKFVTMGTFIVFFLRLPRSLIQKGILLA